MPITKPKFSVRMATESRLFMEGCYEKKKKEIRAGTDWNSEWNWEKENSSFGAYLVAQAMRQTKADFPAPIALALPVQKPKRSKGRKPAKKRGR